MNNKVGSILNYLSVLPLLVFGLIYLFKGSFMPYHSEALSLTWEEIDPTMQFVLLALMRAASGGLLIAGISVIWLQIKFKESKLSWIASFILIIGSIASLSVLYSIVIIRFNTPGNPPAVVLIAVFLGFIAGYLFNMKAVETE